jgi:microcompartment protein CcmL/EutN
VVRAESGGAAPVDAVDVQRALRSVRTSIEAVAHQRGRLPEVLSTLRRRFVLPSFADVEPLPAQADREIRVATELLRIAERHAEGDNWALVRTAVGDVRRALDAATSTIEAVTERLAVLERLSDDPKAPAQRARSVVRDAQRFVESKGDSATQRDRDLLNALSRRVDEAERALSAPRPDFWRLDQELARIRAETGELVRRVRGF